MILNILGLLWLFLTKMLTGMTYLQLHTISVLQTAT